MLYCVLEIGINLLEQYPLFVGLIASRVVGGITTNLLFSVFESWLVTEHRKQGFDEDKLEIILRDTTIVSNSAAIISGYMAHYLASMLGPVGPFEGAVTCTWVALVMVGLLWSENYGSESSESTTFRDHMGKYLCLCACACLYMSVCILSHRIHEAIPYHNITDTLCCCCVFLDITHHSWGFPHNCR